VNSETHSTTDPSPAPPAPPNANHAPAQSHWQGYWALLVARTKELQREPEVVFWSFIFPMLLALGLGIAFRDKPPDLPNVAIINGPQAPALRDRLKGSLKGVKAEIAAPLAARNQFRFGKVDLVVEAAADGSIHYRYAPERVESAFAYERVNAALQRAAGQKDALVTRVTTASEPGSRYIDFLIPGLLGMNLMNSGMWGVGFALVDMRQRKLLRRFVATPMRRSDFLLALTTSRLVFMVAEIGLLLGFGILVFDMPMLGSWLEIVALSTLGAASFGGIGLLTASRAQKIDTVNGLINVVMMPMWIFSGIFFSYERFPALFHPAMRLLPLTALNDALRASILEGIPLSQQIPRLLVLAIWGGVSFIVALRWFRWN
jgi:ABC-2 type transport system permease protein